MGTNSVKPRHGSIPGKAKRHCMSSNLGTGQVDCKGWVPNFQKRSIEPPRDAVAGREPRAHARAARCARTVQCRRPTCKLPLPRLHDDSNVPHHEDAGNAPTAQTRRATWPRTTHPTAAMARRTSVSSRRRAWGRRTTWLSKRFGSWSLTGTLRRGTRSEKGRRWCERIWTVVATCAQQGRSAFDFVFASVEAHFSGLPPPSLALMMRLPGPNTTQAVIRAGPIDFHHGGRTTGMESAGDCPIGRPRSQISRPVIHLWTLNAIVPLPRARTTLTARALLFRGLCGIDRIEKVPAESRHPPIVISAMVPAVSALWLAGWSPLPKGLQPTPSAITEATRACNALSGEFGGRRMTLARIDDDGGERRYLPHRPETSCPGMGAS